MGRVAAAPLRVLMLAFPFSLSFFFFNCLSDNRLIHERDATKQYILKSQVNDGH